MYRGGRPARPSAFPPPHGQESVEETNQQLEDDLKGKIGALKSLSIDIGHEVREHQRLLRDVDDQFDSTQSLLHVSLGKVRQLANSPYRFHLLYLFLFCIFVFLVLWLYI